MSLIKKMVKKELRLRGDDTKDDLRESKMAEDDIKRRIEAGTNDGYEGITTSSGQRSSYKKRSDPWSYT